VPVHLLLVGPEADRLAGPLAAALPGLDVTPVATASAARAYLSGSRFDAVAVRHDTDGGEKVREVAEGLGVARVLVYRPGSVAALAADVGPRLGLAPLVAAPRAPRAPRGAAPEGAGLPADVHEALVGLRAEIGQVAHDLANPLAVVAGNAQLGAELARGLGTDPAIGQAFADIEEAGQTLAARLGQLAALRTRLDALL